MSLTASQKQSYWKRVEGALEIAGAPTELAASLLPEIESLPEDQQELFYHAEPLDVARDLSGVKRWSDEQVRAYLEQSRPETKANDELAISPRIDRRYEEEVMRAIYTDLVTKTPGQAPIQPQELLRLIGKMEAEKRLTKLGLVIAEIVGLAGLAISIFLAVTGLVAVIPAIILTVLTSIITLLLFTLSPKWIHVSLLDAKTNRKNSK